MFYGLLVQIALGHRLTGEVTSEASPLAGVTIYLFDQQQRHQSVVSDEQGAFEFSEVADGWYRLLSIPSVSTNATPLYHPQGRAYCEGQIVTVSSDQHVAISLPVGARVEGQVTLNGEGVANALLVAESLSEEITLPRGNWTDADGRFVISGLDTHSHPSEFNISVEADDIPTQWIGPSYERDNAQAIWVSQQDSIDLEVIELLEGIELGGFVYSGSSPVENATIRVYSGSQITSTLTDEYGEYLVRGLPPGEALAWATADEMATTYSPDSDRPTEFVPVLNEAESYLDLNVSMVEESTIAFRLLDSQTDDPILGSSVLVYNDDRTVGRGQPADDDGVALVNGLHEGDYQVFIYAENDGYTSGFYLDAQGEEAWITLTAQEDLIIDVRLDQTLQLQGNIVDDLGNNVAGASVLLRRGEEQKRAQSNEQGQFVTYGLVSGEWELLVTYAPLCPSDIGYIASQDNPQTLTLDRTDPAQLELVLLLDHDQDQMPTLWEEEVGLDPYSDDSAEDPDLDGITNVDEYRFDTNPFDASDVPPDTCGCHGKNAVILVPLLTLLRRRND